MGILFKDMLIELVFVKNILDQGGSTVFTFSYNFEGNNVTIEKGSITINGVSLTVVNSKKDEFSVAIIPYTLEHTTFKNFKIGSEINLEFDVIGKYVARLTQRQLKKPLRYLEALSYYNYYYWLLTFILLSPLTI